MLLAHYPQEGPQKCPAWLNLVFKALSRQARESAHPRLTPGSTTHWVATSKVLNSFLSD